MCYISRSSSYGKISQKMTRCSLLSRCCHTLDGQAELRDMLTAFWHAVECKLRSYKVSLKPSVLVLVTGSNIVVTVFGLSY